MRLLGVIRSLSFHQLWDLLGVCIMNLNKLYPTWYATKKSITLADRYYGRWHHKNTAANAFRHAIWNYLIAKKCLKNDDQIKDVLVWTEKITDLHEDLFPNDEVARSMDLHNNRVGRNIFVKFNDKSEEEIVILMLELTKHSVMIVMREELRDLREDQLAHLEHMST